jgi:HAE1 family hydrophobic/amphiphilic exporter-1
VPAARSVAGVETVSTNGTLSKNVFVRIRPEALKAKGLSLDQVGQIIAASNSAIPIGNLEAPEQSLPFRINEQLKSLDDERRAGRHR